MAPGGTVPAAPRAPGGRRPAPDRAGAAAPRAGGAGAAGAIVSASGLAIGHRGRALASDIAFSVAAGDTLAVLGHNGSGKSTLLKTLLGLLPPVAGRLEWPGGRPREIGWLGPADGVDRLFPARARDLAAMGAWGGSGPFGRLDARRRRLVDDALRRAGIADIADLPLRKLSSGQLQRALFARAMAQDAPLALLDEPFAAVDQATEAALTETIREWAADGRAVVLVLHDLSAALRHCGKALLLGRGRARFGPPREALAPERLVEHGYLSPGRSEWIAGARPARGGGRA